MKPAQPPQSQSLTLSAKAFDLKISKVDEKGRTDLSTPIRRGTEAITHPRSRETGSVPTSTSANLHTVAYLNRVIPTRHILRSGIGLRMENDYRAAGILWIEIRKTKHRPSLIRQVAEKRTQGLHQEIQSVGAPGPNIKHSL